MVAIFRGQSPGGERSDREQKDVTRSGKDIVGDCHQALRGAGCGAGKHRSNVLAEEFVVYKLMVGRSMGEMYFALLNPIIAQFPDLKPPELN